MKEDCKTSSLGNKAHEMTLKGYYLSLPAPTYPKKDLVKELAQRCSVTEATVRNWIMYGFRPDNAEHVRIISEVTGIPEDNLWKE